MPIHWLGRNDILGRIVCRGRRAHGELHGRQRLRRLKSGLGKLKTRIVMISVRNLLATAVVMGLGAVTAQAQQNLPRPIVLYRPPSSSQPLRPANGPVTRNVTSMTASPTNGSAANTPANTPTSTPSNPVVKPATKPVTIIPGQPVVPGQSAGTVVNNKPGSQSVSPTNAKPGATTQAQNGATQTDLRQEGLPKTPQQEWEEQQRRPTNQMLMNPSGAQNMTHSGISNNQQMAPNTYLGPQFQDWSNQRNVGQMPASFGEMGRFQPTGFGGYVAPNTYVGSGFSAWSNLSQGAQSPGANGSWDFAIWP